MNAIIRFLRNFFEPADTQAALDEAYLAQAVDAYDLERRIRDLDRRTPGGVYPVYGLICLR